MIVIKTELLSAIEKALKGSQKDDHKYIFRKETGRPGRPYDYIYEDDRKLRPIEMLKKFFGIGQKEIDTNYENGNIQKEFGADKKTFAQHLVEYFSHRPVWDKRFAKKENQDKFKKPVKMATFKETAGAVFKDMETPDAESEQPELFSAKEMKPQGEKAWKANPYLMRKIWEMYTGKTVEQQKKQADTATKLMAKKEVLENAKNSINSVGGMAAQYVKNGTATEKPKSKAQILKEVIKPQLFDLGIIPHSQIEATNTEQLDNVKALLETIQTMPKLGEGKYEAKLHYFAGGVDYYITELGRNGEAYGYCDRNGSPQMSEWGYIDLKELAATGDFDGLNIDYFFKPKLVGDLIKESEHRELYERYSDMYGEEEAKLKPQGGKSSEKTIDNNFGIPNEKLTEYIEDSKWRAESVSKYEKNYAKKIANEISVTTSGVSGSLRNKEGLSDKEADELAEKAVNAYYKNGGKLPEKESKQKAHENRNRAMLGNQNAKKMGLSDEEIKYIKKEIARFEAVIMASAKKNGFDNETEAIDKFVTDTLRNILMNNSKRNMIDAPKSFKNRILSIKNEQNLNFAEMAKLLYNDYVEESAQEAHENRSQAMMGNQNAKKYGLSEQFLSHIASRMDESDSFENAMKDLSVDEQSIIIAGAENAGIEEFKGESGFKRLARMIYENRKELKHGENNFGTGRDGLSDNLGNIRGGESEGNGGTDVPETESALDGSEFVQQPRESGIGLGEPAADGGRGAGSGRVTKATARQIRKECLDLLARKKDSEMTAEDKALLAQYEGGGGLNEGGQSTKAVLTEFYTPRDVISKVWELVDKYNPNTKKKVIEPSSGIGRFAEGRSEDFTLCELDETSARIAGILHPESEVKNGAFQKLFMTNNVVTGYKGALYDVAIGNPPYGAYNDLYKGLGEGKQHTRYEEYFIDRSLDTLKDGGILAFVVPSSFLRGKDGKGKQAIAKKGKLLEAWRLPKGTFSSTDVGTDIIIIQKGKGDIADYCDNRYFRNNEAHVIGNETEAKDRFGKHTKVVNLPEGKTVSEAISMIDTKSVEVTAGDSNSKVKRAAEQIEAKTVEADLSKRFTVVGKLQVGAKLTRPDGAEGEIVSIKDGMINYKFNSKTNPFGRTGIEDFAVFADKESEAEAHKNRSEAMKGNENAKKAFHKETAKKAAKGDVFTPSTGENMSAAEFNKKYSKNIPEADMKFWRVTDWEGKVDVTKLTDDERTELGKNRNFVTDENGNFVNVANYASGNIIEKLAKLEAEKDQINKESYEEKKALLEAVLPARKNVMQFTISPLENLASQFKDEEGISLKDKFLAYCGFNEFGNIPYSGNSPIPKSELADGMTMRDIWEYINQVPVRTEKAKDPADKETAKMFAEQKKNARRETTERLFNKWIRELPERQQKAIEDEWNFRFNSRVNPDYKKIPLFVDGMNTHKGAKKFDMTEQQIKGVSMLCNKGNGILAYDVGVGKTVTGIVATVNQIQTGAAKKPLICVPKAVYKKWIKEIKQHFPNVEVNELGNFSEKDLGKFRNSESGLVELPESCLNICTYEALQKITFKEETLNGDLRDDMLDSQSVYDYDEYGNLVEDTRSEREKAQAEEKLMKLLGKSAEAKEDAVFWEDLGIDHITVDELHNFKNIFSIPRTFGKSVRSTNEKKTDYWGRKQKADDDPGQLSNEYSGMQGASSSRGMKMFAITQLIQRETNGRGFFGLSATPFNNSPVEIYNILSLVARNRLKELDIYNLQDFMKQFAELKPDWKVKANGDVESAQVMKNFKNLHALQNLITEFIDKVDGEEAGVIRPYKRIHKPELDLTPLQKAIIKAETDRMDGKFSKPGDDNKNSADALIAMNNMRMATLSPSLIDPKFWADYEDYEGWHTPKMQDIVKESPKLQFVCDTASAQYKARPTEGQVIYMPRGVEQYQYVKEYLVSKGVPADAIAFMDSSTKLDKKEQIKDDFNDKDGKIKIIIGSETIKEGVSLNGNSTTLYNTMLGWNPTETIQVEGRIWRQGNKQGITHIVYPLMNDSIDAMMYQKYDEKSSRLGALWSYKGDFLNVEDINPEELKFELIKDPQKRANMKILQQQADLKKQKKMQDALYDTIAQQQIDRNNLIHNVKLTKERIPEIENDIANRQNALDEANTDLKSAKKAKDDNKAMSLSRQIDTHKYYLNSLKSQLRMENKAVKENEERIGAIENSWKKQGINSPEKVDEKLSEISAKRRATQKEIDEISNKREQYVAEAKAAIEKQQRETKHYTIADRVNYYSNEIGGDLRAFDDIKDQIRADMEKKRGIGIAKAIIYRGRLYIKKA